MPRLIDADALYDKFKNGKSDTEQEVEFNRLGRYLVKHAPTIDAVPVKRGRWTDTGSYVTTAYGHLDIYQCSECGADVTIDDHDSYCPSCGAMMEATP